MKKKLTIIIPAYNEINSIEEVINRVLKTNFNKEIILVDDYSKDGTRELIKKKLFNKVDKVIYHKKNMGKGAAIRSGLKNSTGDVIIIQDADLEYDPNEYDKIVNPIFEGKASVVYGSRFLNNKKHGSYFLNFVANKFLTFLSNIITKQKLTDMETCYKAFDKNIIKNITIEENRFGFEPEITAKISNMGIKIKEVPINYNPRKKKEGKKIGFKDGIRALKCIYKYKGNKNDKK